MAIPSALINLGLAILIAVLVWYASVVWRWGRVLWVCRVPVVSALGGGLLLAATPQARDCFSDLGLAIWQWGLFLALTFAWPGSFMPPPVAPCWPTTGCRKPTAPMAWRRTGAAT